ncbi:hypothetical protein THAOC_33789 [Thalassiosira oceanica]|uniref:Uncharacterized protein n=1 Tax=Thalassiosira oceanica TaxID=159749 RepID=K0RL99_THAOC|nr:hypothetical protein THAOC_33789 [Thalassiosira oceanica]|eukprot:EJK47482.1 hypothetical protein THAOC_33789 [Thalassiosira oceanica]
MGIMKGDAARREGWCLPLSNTHRKEAAVPSSRNWNRKSRKAKPFPSTNIVLGSITNNVWKRATKLPAISLPPSRCRPKTDVTSYGQKFIPYQPATGKGRHKRGQTFTLILLSGLTSLQAHCLHNACSVATSVFGSCLVKITGIRRIIYQLKVEAKLKSDLVLELEGETMSGAQQEKLRMIFQKFRVEGFVDWLRGDKGWRYSTIGNTYWKRICLLQLNTLQSVWTLFAPDNQKFFDGSKRRTTWRKQQQLTEAVSDLRLWLEILDDARTVTVRQVLRNSDFGPNSLVHWAHHHPRQCKYPLTVVTPTSMAELVDRVIGLMQREFHHSHDAPLGTRWINHKNRRLTDWKDAENICIQWDENYLEERLNRDW